MQLELRVIPFLLSLPDYYRYVTKVMVYIKRIL